MASDSKLTTVADVHGAVLVDVEVLRRLGHPNSVRRLLFAVFLRRLVDELEVDEVAVEKHRLVDQRPGLLLGERCVERAQDVVERQAVVLVGAELEASRAFRELFRLFTRRLVHDVGLVLVLLLLRTLVLFHFFHNYVFFSPRHAISFTC